MNISKEMLDPEFVLLDKQSRSGNILSDHLEYQTCKVSAFSEELDNLLLLFKPGFLNPETNDIQYNNYMIKSEEYKTKLKNESAFHLQQIADELKETEEFLSSYDVVIEEKYEEINRESLEIENSSIQHENNLTSFDIVGDGSSKDITDFKNMLIDCEKELEKTMYLEEEKQGILIDLTENVTTLRENAVSFNK